VSKPAPRPSSETTAAVEKAAKQWKLAKKEERAARDELAAVVAEAVASGQLNESKIAKLTSIPRMTIRKMLGKA
jgi:DNA invertase Pin-like site-specific DNA recombinase